MASHSVSKALRSWFLIHFAVDMLFGIPLLLFPAAILTLFGMPAAETVTARLAGAALLGIGGASLITKTWEQHRIMLNLKLIWSFAAIVGLVLAGLEGAPPAVWLITLIFAVFFVVWGQFRLGMRKL